LLNHINLVRIKLANQLQKANTLTYTYLLQFKDPEDKVILEEFKTETSRKSKVVKLLDKAFEKKYGYSLAQLDDFQLFKKK
jgi:hypothetical protein